MEPVHRNMLTLKQMSRKQFTCGSFTFYPPLTNARPHHPALRWLLAPCRAAYPSVTMFAYANELDRYVRCYSWGLRALCRKAPPRCVFHIFLSIKVGTIIIGLYICKC